MAKRHPDALKKARQAIKRNQRNRSALAAVKTLRKNAETAATPEAKAEALKKAVSAIAKAARKKIMHRNKAARIISRLSKKSAAKK